MKFEIVESPMGTSFCCSDYLDQIIPAMIQLQNKTMVREKASGDETPYSSYSDYIKALKPALIDNSLLLMQPITSRGSVKGVETMLYHSSGQFMKSWSPIVEIKKPEGDFNNVQNYGAATTYALRNSLKAFFAWASGDRDFDDNSVEQQEAEREIQNKALENLLSSFDCSEEFKGAIRKGYAACPDPESKKRCYKYLGTALLPMLTETVEHEVLIIWETELRNNFA